MITHEEAVKQSNESYLTTLKQALNLTDLRTLGIERKGFIKHALSWAIEKHLQQEKVEKLYQLKQQRMWIKVDREYLIGIRDTMIEHSIEKPMEHIYSGIKENSHRIIVIDIEISKLEAELK